MKQIRAIAFRYLTDADFFNINKPSGTEDGGGGQSYIDFSTQDVPVARWESFFNGVLGLQRTQGAQGPRWSFPIRSIALSSEAQTATVYQRRSASVSIASQTLGRRRSNRIKSWHPNAGFPRPIDPHSRHQCPDGLVVYMARTEDGEVWAGWLLNDGRSSAPFADAAVRPLLAPILTIPSEGQPRAGMVTTPGLMLDVSSQETPFHATTLGAQALPPTISAPATAPQSVDSELDVAALFDQDVAIGHEASYSVVTVRRRNTRAARALKELYGHTCQITGTEFLFRKRDGDYYTEVHHLIPLGEGGSDDPRNMVVLSPQLHKMLHHADVGPIDLSGMEQDSDGRWHLDISINSRTYRIYWHPEHASAIRSQGAD